MPLEIGLARTDINIYEPNMAMLGWGQFCNQIRGVAEPLHVRALVLVEPDTGFRMAYVVADLLLVSQGLRQAVLERLAERLPEAGFTSANVILTATHTHSGPSGFSAHFWINLAGPGFSTLVFEGLVERFASAIETAYERRRPGRMKWVSADVPLVDGIAFNRSWYAYNQNRDVTPVTRERRDEAVDPTMHLLRLEHMDGRLMGVVNWFPLHGTCVHSDNHLLHPDNKGLAATELEAELSTSGPADTNDDRDGGTEIVALFGQAAPGDVTPNYRTDSRRRLTVGRFDDDFESVSHVAGVQRRTAMRLLKVAENGAGTEIMGDLRCVTQHVDFGSAPAASRYTGLRDEKTTYPAVLGLAMVQGTAEGPGPLYGQRWPRALARMRRWRDATRVRRGNRHYDAKVPFLDLGKGLDGRILGLLSVRRFRLPGADPAFRWVKGLIRSGAVPEGPWIPQVVPLQLVRLGPLVIATMPFEVTTVAGRRLRASLLSALRPHGVSGILIHSYANAYAGYLTTFEEYQVQHYEAGYTLFGPWSLAALQTAFDDLVPALLADRSDGPDLDPGDLDPPGFDVEVLKRHAFDQPWPG